METTLDSTSARTGSVFPAFAGAWLATLIVSWGGMTWHAASIDPESMWEMAMVAPFALGLPVALAVGLVVVPAMWLASTLQVPTRGWWLGAVGIALAPAQLFVIWAATGAAFLAQGGALPRPLLTSAISTLTRDPTETLVFLTALAIGGVVYGAILARASRRVGSVAWSEPL